MGLERAYPPASTIKPLILAAALEAGVVKADETINGRGGSRALATTDGKKHTMTDATPQGSMSLAKMLAVSSNVGAVMIGERLGPARLVGALDTAGLFLPVDGLLVAPASRPSVETSAWHDAVVSIGHDFSVNPLRLVAAYSALASDGKVVTPRFRDESPRTTSLFVSSDTARTVKGMMEGVVGEGGTGSLARVDGMRIAGKTGTGDVDGGLLYASFVGIFPADAPRYVLLVGAETRTGYGGSTAAPRFATLVRRAFAFR